uniref:Uncharacterized protein n=1 Tax=Myoviridae sp. ctkfK18 TaxID=2825165 RepID=A0A8S5VGG8_9CAUD|nr:MAG TPA: hypothetical protein [Myoviridae sp. ctkfK18]
MKEYFLNIKFYNNLISINTIFIKLLNILLKLFQWIFLVI